MVTTSVMLVAQVETIVGNLISLRETNMHLNKVIIDVTKLQVDTLIGVTMVAAM